MYESVLKTATGNPHLDFSLKSVPFPKSERQVEKIDDASGIFVCFVIGICFSLVPAAIISRVVGEKERGIYHIQVVSGLQKVSYYASFLVYDLVSAYVPCILTILLFRLFDLKYNYAYVTLLLYPLSIVPYTYAMSFFFSKESTAQTYAIYLNFLLSSIAELIVFALRQVEFTVFAGDYAMWVMRLVNPTFNLCNTIIYESCGKEMHTRRTDIFR